MIAIIADDLTGAAELGGIGLRFGLSVEINMEVPTSTRADLLIIAANTRSMQEKEAVQEMGNITRLLILLQPEWIYKKVDSVLRGHVVAELAEHLDALGLDRALLAPANPSLGRTIKNGYYFLNDRPVHESSFGSDPEFAITSSRVEDMLRLPVQVRRPGEELPDKGIIVGEVQNREDLDTWATVAGRAGKPFAGRAGTAGAGQNGKPLFLAGAAGFFQAILQERSSPGEPKKSTAPQGYPILFVSGTTFGGNRDLIHGIHAAGGPVYYMDQDNSCEGIVNGLLDQGKAVIAIGEEVLGEPMEAAHIMRDRMAELVSRVLMEVAVEELVIEGGATAYAILTWAGLRTFFPEEELAPGVIRMRAGEGSPLHLTVKPGSYEWPPMMRHRLEN